MPPERAPHTLLRIAGMHALVMPGPVPGLVPVAVPEPPRWLGASIERAPWVVIRRAESRSGLIPVGVRGERRAERLASWLHADAISERVTPCDLARGGAWRSSRRRCVVPALDALDAVEAVMVDHGFTGCWGPTGSVGFELASGCATATAVSDLDLAVWAALPPGLGLARSLLGVLASLAVRSDTLLETPHGAMALEEYALGGRSVLLRTAAGPRLVNDADACWELGATVAA